MKEGLKHNVMVSKWKHDSLRYTSFSVERTEGLTSQQAGGNIRARRGKEETRGRGHRLGQAPVLQSTVLCGQVAGAWGGGAQFLKCPLPCSSTVSSVLNFTLVRELEL